MSGFRSLISAIARSIRSGTKCGEPQCRSDRWASVSPTWKSLVRPEWSTRASEPGATLTGVLLETPDFQAFCGSTPPRFAHAAELEYAKILDFYGIPWMYEPTTFVLERDADGRVAEAFTPDFYL